MLASVCMSDTSMMVTISGSFLLILFPYRPACLVRSNLHQNQTLANLLLLVWLTQNWEGSCHLHHLDHHHPDQCSKYQHDCQLHHEHQHQLTGRVIHAHGVICHCHTAIWWIQECSWSQAALLFQVRCLCCLGKPEAVNKKHVICDICRRNYIFI